MTAPANLHVFRSWVYVVLWMAFIFTMSTDVGSAAHTSRILEPIVLWLKPGASFDDFDLAHFIFRKMAHLTEYAILAVLIFRAIRVSFPRRGPSFWPMGLLLALGSCAAYATTDEFHQSFVPGREASIRDVMIDSTGALVGLIILCLAARIVPARQRKTISL